MRRFLARFSEPVWSGHVPSWADFITTPELKFSVHTHRSMEFGRPPSLTTLPHTGRRLAVRGCTTSPLRPYGLLRCLGALPAKAGAAPDLDTLALAAAADLPAHPHLPEGPQGAIPPCSTTHRGVSSRPGNPIRTRLSRSRYRSTSYVGDRPGVVLAIGHAAALAKSLFNPENRSQSPS